MSSHHLSKKAVFVFGIFLSAFVFLWPPQARSAENGEQALTFSAGAAIAGLRLDSAEPVPHSVSAAPRFSLSDVHLLGKKRSRKSQVPELEPVETYGAFFGLKITLQLKGGWNVFSGGDIENGIGGMYDNAAGMISAFGTPIVQNQKEPNHAGLEFGGDLVYCLTPRFGIGIGWSKVKAGKESVLTYRIMEPIDDSLRTRPEIKVSVLRLGLFYAFPFAGRLAISVHGGPALYSAEYSYNMAVTTGSHALYVVSYGFLNTGLYQEARAKQMGLEGGLGFEFNANPFVAFFVEALGRYARISGFEGEEEATYYQDFHYQMSTKTGSVYFVATDPHHPYPLLDIVPPEGAVGGSARRATLDFSGFSFSAGLKLRF
jgi:hypothetical protein